MSHALLKADISLHNPQKWRSADTAPTDGTTFQALLRDRFGEYPLSPLNIVGGVLYSAKSKKPIKAEIFLIGWREIQP